MDMPLFVFLAEIINQKGGLVAVKYFFINLRLRGTLTNKIISLFFIISTEKFKLENENIYQLQDLENKLVVFTANVLFTLPTLTPSFLVSCKYF